MQSTPSWHGSMERTLLYLCQLKCRGGKRSFCASAGVLFCDRRNHCLLLPTKVARRRRLSSELRAEQARFIGEGLAAVLVQAAGTDRGSPQPIGMLAGLGVLPAHSRARFASEQTAVNLI